MPKQRDIPFSRIQEISGTGVFAKRLGDDEKTSNKLYDAHRDDYYIILLLTRGSAEVEIDFEKKELRAGDIMIISPWQIHGRPNGEIKNTGAWLVAIAAEILSEDEATVIDNYSVAPHPIRADGNVASDIDILCSILERNQENGRVAVALASAVKNMVLSVLGTPEHDASERYRRITLRLRKLLDIHLHEEKRPAAYASMLNISEVYLNEAVKGATGLSAGTYIRNLAMTQARRELACTSATSREIAFALGYDDYAYFSRLFKKCTGKSPSDYRKNLK